MTEEQKLDEVLSFIKNNENAIAKNFGWLPEQYIRNHISAEVGDVLPILLRALIVHNPPLLLENQSNNSYRLSGHGKIFEGFVKKKERQQENYLDGKKILRLTQRTFWWVIAGSIAAIIGLVFVALDFFSKHN